MNFRVTHSSASSHSGKILLAALMLVFVCVIGVVFLGYDTVGKCEETNAWLAPFNSSKALKSKPKVGVVRGIVYCSSGSSALVDETIVHSGDTIHEVAVVGIQSSKVEFSKDSVTWQQAVIEAPHAAWTAPANGDCHPAK